MSPYACVQHIHPAYGKHCEGSIAASLCVVLRDALFLISSCCQVKDPRSLSQHVFHVGWLGLQFLVQQCFGLQLWLDFSTTGFQGWVALKTEYGNHILAESALVAVDAVNDAFSPLTLSPTFTRAIPSHLAFSPLSWHK